MYEYIVYNGGSNLMKFISVFMYLEVLFILWNNSGV